VDESKLPGQLVAALGETRKLLGEARRKIGQVDAAKLSSQAEEMLVALRETVSRVNVIIARLDGDKGLLQSVQHTSDSLGDTARTASGLGAQLDDTMRSMQEVAKSVRKLANALEQEPDMLLKGRRAERKP